MTSPHLKMQSLTRCTIAAAFCAATFVACSTGTVQPEGQVNVPAALRPAAGERPAFTWHGIGAQIYECRADSKGGWGWALVAPEADLYNEKDEKVGTHGVGPHWTAVDGSKAIGAVTAAVKALNPTDVPWLLLSAKSVGGAGKLDAVTSVQRLNTEGGVAPDKGCATVAEAGKRVKQGYTADYVYFVAN